MAQVPWPGVQPSPAGGGEAPTTQEPQPESEATSEETPEVTPATTPLEATEEGDGATDTNYAVDMAAAWGTWDPWPTSTQDSIPTPSPHLRMIQHWHKRIDDRTLIYISVI